MSKKLRNRIAKVAAEKSVTAAWEMPCDTLESRGLQDEAVGRIIATALDKYAEHIRVEALREATKQICMYCDSPEEHRCSVATLQQGEWVHHLPQPGLRDWCKAATIHNLIIQTTKIKDGGG